MGAMAAQHFGSYTEDDLESFRRADEGLRFELVDGELLVTPSPTIEHQLASIRLAQLLLAAAPTQLQVLTAPLDVRLGADTVLQPDLLVVPWAELELDGMRVTGLRPVLVVEVLSPSTRRADLSVKKGRYARAGCPSYWVVDPDVPAVLAWELREGEYVLVGEAAGPQTVELSVPFRVTITPAALLAPPGGLPPPGAPGAPRHPGPPS